LKRRVLMAFLLTVGISATTYGQVTAPILPIPAENFTYIGIPSQVPEIVDLIENEPIIEEKPTILVENEPKVVEITPKPTKKPQNIGRNSHISGTATWYCVSGISVCHKDYPDTLGQNLYAAAGEEIRIGDWRGRTVNVCMGAGNCVAVKLVDWCACGGKRIIDLYGDAFSAIARRSDGVINVTVSW